MNYIFLIILITSLYGFPRSYFLYFVIAVLITLSFYKKRENYELVEPLYINNGAKSCNNFKQLYLSNYNLFFFLFIIVSIIANFFSICFYNSVYGTIILLMLLLFCLSLDWNNFSQADQKIVFNIIIFSGLFQAYYLFKNPGSSGTFTNHSIVAIFLVSCFTALLGKMLFYKNEKLKYDIIFFVIISIGIYLSKSRAVFFSLPISILYFVYKKYGLKIFFYLIIILSVILVMIPSEIYIKKLRLDSRDPYDNKYDPYISFNRMLIWKTAYDGIKKRPLTGYGFGNFDYVYNRYSYPADDFLVKYPRWTQFAHNEHLQVFADTGFFSFILYLFLIIYSIIKGIKSKNEIEIISAGIFIAIFIHSIFVISLHVPVLTILYFSTQYFLFNDRENNIFSLQFSQLLKKTRILSISYIKILSWIVVFGTGLFYLNSCLVNYSKKTNSQIRQIDILRTSLFFLPFSRLSLIEINQHYLNNYQKNKNTDIFEKSKNSFKKYLDIYKYDYDIWSDYALFLYDSGDYKNSINIFNRIINEQPKKMLPYLKSVEYYYNSGDYKNAEKYSIMALNYEPNFSKIYFFLGMIYRKLGIKNYIKYFDKIYYIDINKNKIDSDSHMGGNIYFILDLPAEWYNIVAGEYFEQGDKEKAKYFLNRAVLTEPSNEIYKKNLLKLK